MTTLDEDELPPSAPLTPKPKAEQETVDPSIPYSNYFTSKNFIENEAGEKFCYYARGQEYRNVAIVCIHGAGFSGLSFAQFAAGMADDALIISVDLRGHGFSCDGEMSAQQFKTDLNWMIPAVLQKHSTQQDQFKIVLVGHSLGGSLITLVQSPIIEVLCYVLIDITEHTALASLPNMLDILKRKPQQYPTKSELVQTYLRQRTLTSQKAIRIQLDGLLTNTLHVRNSLLDSQKHWRGWFEGLNDRFISSPAWKLLLVSSLEKLDRDHEIAMMQGKIAVEVVPGAVHNLHEDQVEKVVLIVQEYLRKLHFTQNLMTVPMDFKRGLIFEEKPDELEMIKRKVE
ncbi:Protein_phosphatase methylesterase 1 [Hexamita inflata]|uniref:Protein phosphatase methylesterase 1 n=1 Tax=Hexamita inflata TaxID=28002 RepID=A0AA86PD94_9EUKA|nr:Protein phosphatase methylesterase 1 [Hexamita inflata]